VCWSYRNLLDRVHQAANAYLSLGLPVGGVVALMLPNSRQNRASTVRASGPSPAFSGRS
jgi:acyl-CoA synthetase (AMP-forming)/AMP-acid ligase II